jgi:hypothetical protein
MTTELEIDTLARERTHQTHESFDDARASITSEPILRCTCCERAYVIGAFEQHYLDAQGAFYARGCDEYCLACWFGVGPKDFPESYAP